MKTAMQQMIEYLEENRYFDVVPVAKQLLEEEEAQIVDAACEFMGLDFDPQGFNRGRAEQYYEATYQKK